MEGYKVVIYYSSEDALYIAQVPELAGCMADGATREDALHNVEIVMQEWLEVAKEEGRAIPSPESQKECASFVTVA